MKEMKKEGKRSTQVDEECCYDNQIVPHLGFITPPLIYPPSPLLLFNPLSNFTVEDFDFKDRISWMSLTRT
ncbi:hypothetical protein JTE90_011793 [Oedothorax gibbosus]|uniref:Uncharacterized protein n=1 Tax=Oedothorax gibbosus TaxID=931172 RepID=A0AAV6VRP4_9ARAC|nr:hypothetical protein JTE90_011793 [Oedothorax gibbosus]